MQSGERYFPFSGGPRSELRGIRTNAPYIVEFYQKTNTPYIKERREYITKWLFGLRVLALRFRKTSLKLIFC